MTMPRREVNHLKPLANTPLQAYFDNRLQLADVIDQVLRQIGPADLVISTFSTSDAFIRRLHRLKNEGLVKSCSLFLDLKASRKTVLLAGFIKSVFDAVFLCENHSKVVLLKNDSHHVTIVTSQNQTQGNRMECGIITTNNDIYQYIAHGFLQLKTAALPLDRL
ncbi:hypothetical protein [Sodaliphilus pleomorphus]|nr:hypothetical protein [Sodaliphilus pleomorphus]